MRCHKLEDIEKQKLTKNTRSISSRGSSILRTSGLSITLSKSTSIGIIKELPSEYSTSKIEKTTSTEDSQSHSTLQFYPEDPLFEEDIDEQELLAEQKDRDCNIKTIRLSSSKINGKALNKYERRKIGFNIYQFITFFMYHLVYFMILGPFINIPGWVIVKNWGVFSKNLDFSNCDRYLWSQPLIWILNISMMMSFYFSPFYFSNYSIIHTFILTNFIRCFTVASKYATFTSNQIAEMSNRPLTLSEKYKESLFADWGHQKTNIQIEEIDSAMQRLSIENSNFHTTFMVNPRDETDIDLDETLEKYFIASKVYVSCIPSKFRELKKHIKDLNKEGFELDLVTPLEIKVKTQEFEKNMRFYCGKIILLHLISKANKSLNKKYGFLINSLIIIARLLVICLTLTRFYLNFNTDYLLFFIILIGSTLHSSYFLIFYLTYLQQAILDFQRKEKVMAHLNEIITVDRKDYKMRYLPIINLADITSINSWLKMRTMTKEYGRKFFKRQEALMSFEVCNMIISLGLFLFSYFTIQNIESTNLMDKINYFNNQKSIFMGLMLLDFLVHLVYILVLFFMAAQINKYYDIHIHSLLQVKEILKELYTLGEHYFGYDREEFSLIKLQRKKVLKERVTDPILKVFVMNLKMMSPKERTKRYLGELIENYESVIKNLKEEKEYDQVTVLGIQINMSVFINTLVAGMGASMAGIRLIMSQKTVF